MTANLLILLVVVLLALLCAWLTVAAVRNRKLWVKIAGGVGAGLLTLILAAIAFFGGNGLRMTYSPGAAPAPDLKVAATPAQIARGDYLVNLSCIGCHSPVGPDGRPTEQHPLSGGWNIAVAEGFGFVGDMVAENLTPGGKLASYSDGELFRVLRNSIDQQGDRLAFMAFLPYNQLSNEDLEAIIAYLRSLPPAPTPGPTGDRLSFLGAVMFGAGMFGPPSAPAPAVVAAPPAGVTAEYGKYVATYAECRGCHGPDAAGSPATSVSPAVPNPRPLVGTLSQEQFFTMMRTGVKPNGVAFPETMPWKIASRLTDDDLAALYRYLTAPVN